MEKYVRVPLKEYLQLQEDSLELNYLEHCGVDNWEPGISKNEYAQDNGEESWEDMQLTEDDCEILDNDPKLTSILNQIKEYQDIDGDSLTDGECLDGIFELVNNTLKFPDFFY